MESDEVVGGTGLASWEDDEDEPAPPSFSDMVTAPAKPTPQPTPALVVPKLPVAKRSPKRAQSRAVVAMFVNQNPQDEYHAQVLRKSQDFLFAELSATDSVSVERRVVPSTTEGTDSAIMRTFRDLLHSQMPSYCDSSVTQMKDEEARAYGCASAGVTSRNANVFYSQVDKIKHIALFTHDTFLAAAAAEYASAHATGKTVTIIFDNTKRDDLFSSYEGANANGKRANNASSPNVNVVQYVRKPPEYSVIKAIKSFSQVSPRQPLVILFDCDGGGYRERAEAFVASGSRFKPPAASPYPPSAWSRPKPKGGGKKKKK
jgi:hypothetical protein